LRGLKVLEKCLGRKKEGTRRVGTILQCQEVSEEVLEAPWGRVKEPGRGSCQMGDIEINTLNETGRSSH
jgi:hypothetical protein